ncbi:spore protease YyaC [Paenibacillus sp. FSL R5-0527]|uniref:spore protease YyaC n=1 Tax=Paenibacillus sp. FSL R5-0527 TaxID=2975321 RepID=UPI0030F88135
MRYNQGTSIPGGGEQGNVEVWKGWPQAGLEPTKLGGGELDSFFQKIYTRHQGKTITFLCIGTDRSTGDALGPLVGTKLAERGIKEVVGTLREPCDAGNLQERMAAIPPENIVVAIDACLGAPGSVGYYLVSEQPLQPAQSVGSSLPAAGHYSVAAVVNVKGPKPYWTLQMTSLYKVMQMADEIAAAAAVPFGK